MRVFSMPVISEINAMTSLFALPSWAGARTLHVTAFLHELYPAGKHAFFEPAVTSMVMTVPFSEEESAGVKSVMSHPKVCRPALTTPDHQWRAAVLHHVFPIAGRCLSRNRVVPWLISRSSPVDHPGTYGGAVSARSLNSISPNITPSRIPPGRCREKLPL